MSNTLYIYLDQGNAIVDESGGANHVKRKKKKQKITWKLAGDAYKGSITSFAWNPPAPPPPPAKPFGIPKRSPKKKHLHVTDLNDDDDTAGEWEYTLKIKVETTTYTVVASGPTTATVTNPTIKNN